MKWPFRVSLLTSKTATWILNPDVFLKTIPLKKKTAGVFIGIPYRSSCSYLWACVVVLQKGGKLHQPVKRHSGAAA
jgi:hypothetical protein